MQVLVCNDDHVPKLVSLRNTCIACPSQWEGTLEDGRAIYARYRHGELSVGVGNDINEAVRNGMSDQALYASDIGNGLDGFRGDRGVLSTHGYPTPPAASSR